MDYHHNDPLYSQDNTNNQPDVTSTVGLADSSSNSLPVNGNATPGDRGEGGGVDIMENSTGPQVESETIHGSRGKVNKEADGRNVTSGGIASGRDEGVEGGEIPVSDLRELEGEVNREATTASGRTSCGEADGRIDLEWKAPCNGKDGPQMVATTANGRTSGVCDDVLISVDKDGVEIDIPGDVAKLDISDSIVLSMDNSKIEINDDDRIIITNDNNEVLINNDCITITNNEMGMGEKYVEGIEPPTDDIEDESNNIFGQLEYYKNMYNILEDKLSTIWNQKEAFRLATERMSNTLIKNNNINKNLSSDSDDDSLYKSKTCRLTPINNRCNTVQNYKGYMSVRDELKSNGVIGYKKPHYNMIDRLIKSGKKLYALRICNSGIRKSLYLDVGYIDSIHCGNVFVGNNIGIFKISIIPNEYIYNDNISNKLLNYFGYNNDSTITNVFNTLADFSGISWLNDNGGNGDDDVKNPHINIRYIHTLNNNNNKLNIMNNTLPKNSYISTIFNGNNDKLTCLSTTSHLKKKYIYSNHNFEFILKTKQSNNNKSNCDANKKRFNNNVYIINSITKQYLCIDMLTYDIKFDDEKITNAYSKYIVPACFKLVPLYNLIEGGSGLPVADLREAEGEVNRRGSTPSGKTSGGNGRDSVYIYNECMEGSHGVTSNFNRDMKYMKKKSSRLIDCHGNFAPTTKPAGTPAPSPRCKLTTFNIHDSDDEDEGGEESSRQDGSIKKHVSFNDINYKKYTSCEHFDTQMSTHDNVKNLKMKFEKLTQPTTKLNTK